MVIFHFQTVYCVLKLFPLRYHYNIITKRTLIRQMDTLPGDRLSIIFLPHALLTRGQLNNLLLLQLTLSFKSTPHFGKTVFSRERAGSHNFVCFFKWWRKMEVYCYKLISWHCNVIGLQVKVEFYPYRKTSVKYTTTRTKHSTSINPRPNKKTCGSGYPIYPNILPPTLNFFFSILVKLFI